MSGEETGAGNQTQPAAGNADAAVVKFDRPASPSLLDLVRERKELSDLLTDACALIEIEASDHKTDHKPTHQQRKDIASTLLRFTTKARGYLSAVGDRESAATRTEVA